MILSCLSIIRNILQNTEYPRVKRLEGQVTAAMRSKVAVLDKVLAVLRVFPRGDVAFAPREICARTGLSLPTVYRLAGALEEHGVLEKDGERFKLGLSLLHLGARVAWGIELR